MIRRAGQAARTGDARTAIIPVRFSTSEHLRAHEACHAAAGNWNETVEWVRSMWADGYHHLSESDMVAFAGAGSHLLHSQTLQETGRELHKSIKTYRENKKNGLRGRAPWRHKNYMPLTWTSQGWRIKDTRLVLSMGRGAAPFTLPVPAVVDARTGLPVPPQDWGSIQLCWDRDGRRWTLHIAYRTHQVTALPAGKPHDPDTVTIAIDEGVIHAMALAVEQPDTSADVLIISGRKARDIKRARNKRVASIQKQQARYKNGSRKHRRLARARGRAQARADRRLRNFNHNVAAKAERFIRDAAVDPATGEIHPVRIVVGDVRGIEQNTRRKKARRQRQELSQWNRGTQETYLEHKTGLSVEHINEAYTTKTCLNCSTLNNTTGRNYRCKNCRHEAPRDAVGALNILSKAVNAGTIVPRTNTDIRVTYQRAVEHHSARPAVDAKNQATTHPRGVTGGEHAPTLAPSQSGAVSQQNLVPLSR